MNTQQATQSPKAKQFSEELNALCAKYQYSLVPKIQSTENGIIPWLAIVEVLPPKEEIKPMPVPKMPIIKKPAKKRKK